MTDVERDDQGDPVVGAMLAVGVAALAIWAMVAAIVKALAI